MSSMMAGFAGVQAVGSPGRMEVDIKFAECAGAGRVPLSRKFGDLLMRSSVLEAYENSAWGTAGPIFEGVDQVRPLSLDVTM